MPIQIDQTVAPQTLAPTLRRVFEISGEKIQSLEKSWNPSHGTPVFTAQGKYTSRGWTEWTQGFQFGSALLQFDATEDAMFLEIGRQSVIQHMASHVSHVGVHDHGFNNVSTYGNLLRLAREGRITASEEECRFYELALKVSGAVQAARWTPINDGTGYIYSFNGPHSLFIDTMRSLRSLAIAHQLGHLLMAERDVRISLLDRLAQHALATTRFSIYYGTGRDHYDLRGRTAHESLFNTKDGSFRCPSSQQGYSPFSTWTRGLAWGLTGFAEQLEFFHTLPRSTFAPFEEVNAAMLKAALATADFYLDHTCTDGIPMWDTDAPGLRHLGDYLNRPSDPFNAWEPVDSSAAAITAQGLLRLGNYLNRSAQNAAGHRYRQAAFTIARTLFAAPYLSEDPTHQGLIIHSVYHRPNGWDYLAPHQKVPNGESSMWGDYHARELALMILREAEGKPYYAFYNCLPKLK